MDNAKKVKEIETEIKIKNMVTYYLLRKEGALEPIRTGEVEPTSHAFFRG